ncbi:DUF4097 family beta strand repeat-containing protein [Paenibacillus thalictri]|uniref:DUF4097 domain-containing protein n=1 Tax=Paenibacillus thalictri TaxID=2527873 RepID=A0A4Q9DUC2_9BACL|nr:DUF4097 family beta strand repeat-containing protein [Paenibacillus thalictri]TBL80539.1 hypothetical protein EYB31_04745 [Paenibacillus thalictri]
MRKIGRYTAALLLVGVGVAVIAGKQTGTDYTALAARWWPVLLISLGIEYVLFQLIYGRTGKPTRLDIGGMLLACILSAVVFSTQNSVFSEKWFRLDGLFSLSSESGNRFDKPVMNVPLERNAEKVLIDNPSGSVTVKSGAVEQIQIDTTVWVDNVDAEDAAGIAGQSTVESLVSNGSLKIEARGKEYGSGVFARRKPRMNLTVTVPSGIKADIELSLVSGKAEASQLPIRGQFTASTINGEIDVSDLEANVKLNSTNGNINAQNIKGTAVLKTVNGSVSLLHNQGDARLTSTNGSISAVGISGSLQAETINGSLTVSDALRDVNAHTTNGSINAKSSSIQGNWDLKTMHGSIDVLLPAQADLDVKGKGGAGQISSDFPLQTDKRSLRGQIGSGTYRLDLDTNGRVSVRKAD